MLELLIVLNHCEKWMWEGEQIGRIKNANCWKTDSNIFFCMLCFFFQWQQSSICLTGHVRPPSHGHPPCRCKVPEAPPLTVWLPQGQMHACVNCTRTPYSTDISALSLLPVGNFFNGWSCQDIVKSMVRTLNDWYNMHTPHLTPSDTLHVVSDVVYLFVHPLFLGNKTRSYTSSWAKAWSSM